MLKLQGHDLSKQIVPLGNYNLSQILIMIFQSNQLYSSSLGTLKDGRMSNSDVFIEKAPRSKKRLRSARSVHNIKMISVSEDVKQY